MSHIKTISKTGSTLPTADSVPNCLSVDVEDYFQVSAFADRVCRKDWDKYECRVEANTDRLLSLFDEAEVQGTFFVLGWVADRYPGLIRRIVAAGHELASHGYWHELVYNQTPDEFAADIEASKEALANASGVVVTAYRAPSFSIVPRSRWALDILAEHGFTVDSSIFPIRGHDRYGDPDAPREIHQIATAHGLITEFPPTAGYLTSKVPIPIGGGYFRLFPLGLTRRAIRTVRQTVGPAMFYIHPWEVDPEQPRIEGLGRKSRFRHYTGLSKSEARLKNLLQREKFGSCAQVLGS